MSDNPNLDIPRERGNKKAPAQAKRRDEDAGVTVAQNGSKVVAIGRDGKPISRKRTGSSDMFEIPKHMIPDGWSYEWKRELMPASSSVDMAHQMAIQENGWTPVPADRHRGMFMEANYSGPIRREGMMLMERPSILTREARQEEYDKARTQISNQQEQLGFTKNTPYARRQDLEKVSVGYVSAEDAPRPQLQIEE